MIVLVEDPPRRFNFEDFDFSANLQIENDNADVGLTLVKDPFSCLNFEDFDLSSNS